MILRTVIVSVLLALAPFHQAPRSDSGSTQQMPNAVFKRVGMTDLARVGQDGRTSEMVYHSDGVSISNLAVAADGRFVALVETTDLNSLSKRLVVLDPTSKVARVVQLNVQTYVWCCGENRVAVITGTYREGNDLGGFRPTGAFLIDVQSGTQSRLDVPGDVHDVRWASFDGALYFRTGGQSGSNIVRYDPLTGASRVTGYRDLRFSPSGTFYLHYVGDPALGRHGWHIFERVTGREVPLPDPSLGTIEDWVFGEGDYLRLKRVTAPAQPSMIRGREQIEGYTIFDVVRGTAAAQIQDTVRTDVVTPPGTLALARGGALDLVRSLSEVVRK